MKFKLKLKVLVLSIILAFQCVNLLAQSRSVSDFSQKNPSYGKQAPAFEGKTISGESFNLDEVQGKVILLNFWTRGCPSCVREMPDLNRIYSEYKDREDFIMLSIYVGDEEDRMKKIKVDFPLISEAKYIADSFGVYMYPESYLIDKNKMVTDILPYVVMRSKPDENFFFNMVKKKIDALL